MLILTRRPLEAIHIIVPASSTPTKVVVTTLGVKGNQVRMGIDAPRNVVVDREEIQLRKLKENSAE